MLLHPGSGAAIESGTLTAEEYDRHFIHGDGHTPVERDEALKCSARPAEHGENFAFKNVVYQPSWLAVLSDDIGQLSEFNWRPWRLLPGSTIDFGCCRCLRAPINRHDRRPFRQLVGIGIGRRIIIVR